MNADLAEVEADARLHGAARLAIERTPRGLSTDSTADSASGIVSDSYA
jgi:hypothetical protein